MPNIPPDAKPTTTQKAQTRSRLLARGVAHPVARHLAGETDDLTAREIAERRIAWQRTLKPS